MSDPRSFPSALVCVLSWLRAGPWWRWLLLVGFLASLGVLSYVARGWSGVIGLGSGLVGILILEVVVTNPARLSSGLARTTLPVSAFLATFLVAPERVASTEFYKAVAQVLPVLLLTFFVDKHREFHAAMHVSQRLSSVMVIVYLVTASYQTALVLAADNASLGSAKAVIAALVAATTALALSLITPPQDVAPTPPDTPRQEGNARGERRVATQTLAARALGRSRRR